VFTVLLYRTNKVSSSLILILTVGWKLHLTVEGEMVYYFEIFAPDEKAAASSS